MKEKEFIFMNTVQGMNRKEKTWVARQNCLKKLETKNFGYRVVEQERQEKKTQKQCCLDEDLHGHSTLGIRLFFCILCFLFVFCLKEFGWSYKAINYSFIKEQVAENYMVEQMEEQAEIVFLDTKN